MAKESNKKKKKSGGAWWLIFAVIALLSQASEDIDLSGLASLWHRFRITLLRNGITLDPGIVLLARKPHHLRERQSFIMSSGYKTIQCLYVPGMVLSVVVGNRLCRDDGRKRVFGIRQRRKSYLLHGGLSSLGIGARDQSGACRACRKTSSSNVCFHGRHYSTFSAVADMPCDLVSV